MNALVVEDEKLMNWSLTQSLDKWGFNTRSAYSAQEALEAIHSIHFDVVLLDYHLPDQNGLQIARKVRAKLPSAQIYMITAFQLSELPLGGGLVDGYFNKPVDLKRLRAALESAGNRRESDPGIAPEGNEPN